VYSIESSIEVKKYKEFLLLILIEKRRAKNHYPTISLHTQGASEVRVYPRRVPTWTETHICIVHLLLLLLIVIFWLFWSRWWCFGKIAALVILCRSFLYSTLPFFPPSLPPSQTHKEGYQKWEGLLSLPLFLLLFSQKELKEYKQINSPSNIPRLLSFYSI